jgi:cytochrome c-type biogenesis protein CcmH/NrfG
MTKGNIQTFTYEQELNRYIESLTSNPDGIEEIDPQLMISFLEKKLKKEPRDINGWLILTRTCVISGYYQKADMHYKSALKNFPENENLLLEYSILKKNTKQTKSALNYLIKLKNFYPNNLKARELIIDILFENSREKIALKEIKELFNIRKNDSEYIKKIKERYNLK